MNEHFVSGERGPPGGVRAGVRHAGAAAAHRPAAHHQARAAGLAGALGDLLGGPLGGPLGAPHHARVRRGPGPPVAHEHRHILNATAQLPQTETTMYLTYTIGSILMLCSIHFNIYPTKH